MLADEAAAPAQQLDRAVDVDGVVRQRTPARARVAGEHADAAVDAELRVAQGGTCARGQPVQLVSMFAQVGAERLQQRGPLVERQLAQRWPAAMERNQAGFLTREVPELVDGHGIALLVDGAHAAGMLPVDLGRISADFWVTSDSATPWRRPRAGKAQ